MTERHGRLPMNPFTYLRTRFRRRPNPAEQFARGLTALAETYVPGGYATVQIVADRTSVEVSGCSDDQRAALLAVALFGVLEGEQVARERAHRLAVTAGQGRWV